MARAIIGVLDSFGVGAAPDAGKFGDDGANTFGHIAESCARGDADSPGLRAGRLHLPNLVDYGLAHLGRAAAGKDIPLTERADGGHARGIYGFAAEQSFGKDTPSGHWEMMGLPVLFDWGFFPPKPPSFPPALLDALIGEAGLPGVLGDCHASGTVILDDLGEEHIASGKPIVYTSADSVFQIAAHETHFGLQRLYEICAIARRLVDDYQVGRVIARPFVGERRGEFRRTGARRDLTTPPHGPTLLDRAKEAGAEVIGIGKIGDIFAYKGLTQSLKAEGNDAIMDQLLASLGSAPDGSVIFANFVDFDTLFGHRRNVPGYAAALEAFDRRLPELTARLKPGDLAVLTADHGCDPTFPGSDHTREYVPVLGFGPGIEGRDIGARSSFADIGQSLAAHLGLAPLSAGTSFLG